MVDTTKKMIAKSAILLVIAVSICTVNGGRRGSFGKRVSKPSSGSRASIKDSTPEPEQTVVTEFNSEAGDADNMKCGSLDMKLSEKQILHLKECAQSVGVASKADLTLEKFPCFAKCIFEHKRLVDEKGKPHKENIANMFSETMPDQVKETLKTALNSCLEKHADLVEPGDETCATYTPLAMCVHMAYTDTCKNV